jgi:hypothetical protein
MGPVPYLSQYQLLTCDRPFPGHPGSQVCKDPTASRARHEARPLGNRLMHTGSQYGQHEPEPEILARAFA